MTFAHLGLVHLIWVVVAIVALLVVLEIRARGAFGQFLTPVMQRRLAARPSGARVAARLILLAIALVAGVLALMRPQSRGEPITVT